MISYLNDEQLKTDLLKEVQRHEQQDQIIKGTYGKMNGIWKGCAVGCSIHSLNAIREKNHRTDNHSVYEIEFGIPRIIAKLQDRIFEGLPEEDAKRFPYRFLAAIPVGKNLDPVWRKFFIWVLTDPQDGVIKYAKREQTKKAIQDVSDLLEKSLAEKITSEQFLEVRKAAYAAYAADAAAAHAADAAAYAAYAGYAAAAAAADDAADDAAYGAYAAAAADDAADDDAAYGAYAAYAAAADAADAYAADAGYAADAADARKIKYVVMSEKLIKLLEQA